MNETQATQATTTRRRSRSRSRSKGRSSSSDAKPIRVWCAGSYDMLHFGHISFLRKVNQEMMARFPKVEMVIGLYSDQDLTAIGQQPVFSIDERYAMLRANKWVHEIVKGAPFELSKEILKEKNCDYAFTFDDFDLPKYDEKSREELLQCGLLKTVTLSKQESRISSSHIVNRMMLLEQRDENNNTTSGRDWAPKRLTFPGSISCKEIIRFATGSIPKEKDRIVYVDGSFDMLHPGHLNLLEKARALGDFLYVGLHGDETISKYAGSAYPIMQWNERLMALLSCKYVSEVVIDSSVGVDESLLKAFSVSVVVPSIDDYCVRTGAVANSVEMKDMYAAAKKKNIFHEIPLDDSQSMAGLTTMSILNRVHQNWTDFSYAVDKSNSNSDVESDLDEVNISQNRDAGDVLKFSSSDNNSVH